MAFHNRGRRVAECPIPRAIRIQLSAQCGVDERTILALYRGDTQHPHPSTLRAIANAAKLISYELPPLPTRDEEPAPPDAA